ncbi:MAG: transcriptional repressor LexA [Nitrospirae bacterium]|nr:transcriptional repressor LexA [Nitrospirota bacterium]
MKELTEKQRTVYKFLAEFMRRRGYPPTIREIGEHFGFLWSAARGHLQALERKGYVRLDRAKSRGIELRGWNMSGGLAVPVAGKVRAGKPMLAAEQSEESLFIDRALFQAEDAFALKITGDSMIDAGIWEGDYVIVKPQETIGSGEIGVVFLGDEATVKRIYVKKGEITLKPENREMEPATYRAGEVRIIGRVIGVVRKL